MARTLPRHLLADRRAANSLRQGPPPPASDLRRLSPDCRPLSQNDGKRHDYIGLHDRVSCPRSDLQFPEGANMDGSAPFGATSVEQRPTESLVPYARNARTHSEAQVAAIAGSIREFGFNNPVLVDGENGIIAGHGRVLAARTLGLDTVPVIELTHLSESAEAGLHPRRQPPRRAGRVGQGPALPGTRGPRRARHRSRRSGLRRCRARRAPEPRHGRPAGGRDTRAACRSGLPPGRPLVPRTPPADLRGRHRRGDRCASPR